MRTARQRWNTFFLKLGLGRLKSYGRQSVKLLKRAAIAIAYYIVFIYRNTLRQTTFIAITGSCGKTSTKELAFAILQTRLHGRANRGTRNYFSEMAQVIFSVRKRDSFCIQEVSIGGAAEMVSFARKSRLFRPDIAVVTNIGHDHISAFADIEAIAAEKSQLVAAVPKSGVAILNADDPRVMAMRSKCRGRVLTFGLSNDALVRAQQIESVWPGRLRFTVHYNHEQVEIQTQLCGKHFVNSTLAAIAMALQMNLTLAEIAEALHNVPPFEARMSPVQLADDVAIIRDDWKAPLWTLGASFEFMEEAQAHRKIVILGTISDMPERNRGKAASTYQEVAKHVLRIADHVVFVGPWASKILGLKGANDNSLFAFSHANESIPFLKEFLQPRDLVLLKGSDADRLVRIVTALKHHRFTSPVPAPHFAEARSRTTAPQLIVGLGNPGKQFERTPHNVGRIAIDLIAENHGATWELESQHQVCRIDLGDRTISLVKLDAAMNETGGALRELRQQMDFDPEAMILVHDDIQLPIGVVRSRMKGSAGGHKGIESVVNAFQTERIRRVKIGVDQPADKNDILKYVLTPFPGGDWLVVEASCHEAAKRVGDLVLRQVSTP